MSFLSSFRRAHAWLALLLLVAASASLRAWAATRVPIPWIAPDELHYALLGRSLYESGSLDLLGEPTRFYSLVTPALAGLPLAIGDLELGYRLLQVLQAVVISLAAVPVYLWGRRLTTPGWALVAAALTLAVPGLAYAGLIMTEVALYPLLVLALWALARTLVRPTIAAQALAAAAVLAATATRLQAVVLVPAFVTAALSFAAASRDFAVLRRLWPTWLAFAAGGLLWALRQLGAGAPLTDLLGGYRAAAESGYDLGDALRFIVYHAADVVLFTGLVPVCATVLLLLARPKAVAERAFLAVTWSTTAWSVALVGVFASRHVGHLAERNLFALAPLFFLGLVRWLERGGPRPRIATPLVATAAFLLVLVLPIGKLVTEDAIHDSFTLIPLWRLHIRAPGVSLEATLAVLAAVAALAFVLLPRRRLPLLPALLFITFAVVSISASRVVSARATLTQAGTLGPEPRWVDEAADRPTAYLYTGDIYWTSVWQTAFWNRRLRSVYDLQALVPGAIPQRFVEPADDGVLADGSGRPVRAPYVVSSISVRVAGRRAGNARNGIVLWRAAQPVRLEWWARNIRFDGTIERAAHVLAYACRGGSLRLRLVAPEGGTVVVRREDRVWARRKLDRWERWNVTVPTQPRAPLGTSRCTFDIAGDRPIRAERVRFVAPAASS
jgi:hypothetical protein